MHNKRLLPFVFFAFSALPSFAQGTAFTYQGRLNNNGAPASGVYDLQFTVFDSPGGATVPAHKLHIASEGASGYAIGIEGNATQARDKGGWMKAMAKVNADGTIARQFSALGGNITGSFFYPLRFVYRVTFPFAVDDRFISVTPHYNNSVGTVAAVVIQPCSSCGANAVDVVIADLDDPLPAVANEFFSFVY
jgi:hypothetical protein